MGLDLTLLPLLNPNFWASHDMLRVDQNDEFFDAVDALPQMLLPEPLHCYKARRADDSESTYGNVTDDPYGDPLKFTYATHLITLRDHPSIADWASNYLTHGALAYLAHMPGKLPVVLWWH